MVEVLYTVFFCACHTIAFLSSMAMNRYDPKLLIVCYACAILSTLFAYHVYKSGEDNNDGKYYMTFAFNMKQTSIFIFVLLIATFLFFLRTGYGAASGSVGSGAVTSLFNLLDVNAVIWIYYFYGREYNDSKLFWPIIIIYCIYQAAAGWSGFLMYFAFYEVYFWAKRHNKENTPVNLNFILRVFGLCLLLIGGAAIAYTVVYPLKFYIRNGTASWNITTLSEGYTNVTNRISYFPSMFRSVLKHNDILFFYKGQNDIWAETKSIFKPLIPGALMTGKEKIVSLGRAIPSAWFGTLRSNESDSISALFHLGTLYTISPLLGIVQTILFIFAFQIMRGIYRRFERYPGQFRFLIFMTAMNFTRTGNIESLFSQHFGHLLYLIPIMFAFGCIRVNTYPENYLKLRIRKPSFSYRGADK